MTTVTKAKSSSNKSIHFGCPRSRAKQAHRRANHAANRQVRASLYSKFPRELKNERDLREWHETLNALSAGAR